MYELMRLLSCFWVRWAAESTAMKYRNAWTTHPCNSFLCFAWALISVFRGELIRRGRRLINAFWWCLCNDGDKRQSKKGKHSLALYKLMRLLSCFFCIRWGASERILEFMRRLLREHTMRTSCCRFPLLFIFHSCRHHCLVQFSHFLFTLCFFV